MTGKYTKLPQDVHFGSSLWYNGGMNTKTKVCTGCGIEKTLAEFHKWSRSGDGRQCRCKECINEYFRQYGRRVRLALAVRGGPAPGETKVCTGCRRKKPLSEFHKKASSRDGHGYRCKDCANEGKRRRDRELKRETFENYGGCTCAYPECGVTDIDLLTLDHINGGGRRHRKEIGNGSVYRDLRDQGYPRGYQVLCRNHNCGKAWMGKKAATKHAMYRRKLKREVFAAYGGAICVHPGCGITDPDLLTLDHTNGDGAKHRREMGAKTGWLFYARLRNRGYPSDPPLQVLCWNHNHKKHLEDERRRRDSE